MSVGVSFAAFRAGDAMAIALQPSQYIEAGIDMRALDAAGAADLEANGPAWTARAADGRILCCAGFREIFAGRQAVAWSMLAAELGVRQHLAITRFARARFAESPLLRIESMFEARPDGRCAKWAETVGMVREGLLHAWGPASVPVFVYARIKPCRL